MTQSNELKDLALALSKAQSEIVGALKDAANPFFKSKYADLPSVWDAIRAPLTKNGLAVVQATDVREGQTGVVTTLMHSTGQWIQGFYPLNPIKNDPQGMGSAMTYARRYALAAMVGVVQIDDDGEAAMGRNPLQQSAKSMQPGPNDGFSVPDESTSGYRIPFGKFAKKGLHEVPVRDLADYIEYLERTSAKEPGKPMRADAVQFISRAREFIEMSAGAEQE